jgi:hypothetical protein
MHEPSLNVKVVEKSFTMRANLKSDESENTCWMRSDGTAEIVEAADQALLYAKRKSRAVMKAVGT